MQIPNKKESKLTKEEEKFINKLQTIPSQRNNNVLQRYANRCNNIMSSQEEIKRHAEILSYSNLENSKQKYYDEINILNEQGTTFSKTTEFTLKTINDLERVKKCKIENKTLIVITNEQEFDQYKYKRDEWRIDHKWKMPSYEIKYKIVNQQIDIFQQEVPEEFLKDSTKPVISLSINLANDEDKNLLKNSNELLNNETHNNSSIASPSITPYSESFTTYTQELKTNGISNICYGSSTDMQKDLLDRCDIFPHLYNLLQTLYTEDITGRGYTTWLKKILREEVITKTQVLYEKIGNFEGIIDINKNHAPLIAQTIQLHEDKQQVTLKKTKKLTDLISKTIEDNSNYTLSTDSTFNVIKIYLKEKESIVETNGIKGLLLKLEIKLKEDETIKTNVTLELTKEDLKTITKINLPNGQTTFKELNNLLKNIYENNITIQN